MACRNAPKSLAVLARVLLVQRASMVRLCSGCVVNYNQLSLPQGLCELPSYGMSFLAARSCSTRLPSGGSPWQANSRAMSPKLKVWKTMTWRLSRSLQARPSAYSPFLFLRCLPALDGLSRELNVLCYFRRLVSVENWNRAKAFHCSSCLRGHHRAVSCPSLDALHVAHLAPCCLSTCVQLCV